MISPFPHDTYPKVKTRKVIYFPIDSMFKNPIPIKPGMKIFLYYAKEDRFIERGQVDKLPGEDKLLVFWVPAINKKNAIRKLKKQFKTQL